MDKMSILKEVELVDDAILDYLDTQDFPGSTYDAKKREQLVIAWHKILGKLNMLPEVIVRDATKT